MATLLWLVLPYLALAAFVLGHVWRWRYDQFGWRTFRTPLVDNRLLRCGSPLVHLGLVAVVIGHAIGLLVPRSWTAALGISDAAYHLICWPAWCCWSPAGSSFPGYAGPPPSWTS